MLGGRLPTGQERQQQPMGVAVLGIGARGVWHFPWQKPPALTRLTPVS